MWRGRPRPRLTSSEKPQLCRFCLSVGMNRSSVEESLQGKELRLPELSMRDRDAGGGARAT